MNSTHSIHLKRRVGPLVLSGVGVVAATLAVALPNNAGAAKALSCGSTITKSTRLTKDITGCTGQGLKIGADGITLDLNGHTVSAAARRNPKAHGIFNEGYDRVTIKGGTVSGFGAYGVRLSHADRNVVEDMKLVENFTGVGLFEATRGVIRQNEITGAKFVGANLTGGKGSRIVSNQIVNSNGPGVFIHSSPAQEGKNHRVESNALEGNGIEIQPGPRATRALRNTIKGAPGDGIMVFEPASILQGNSVTGSLVHGINAPNGVSDLGGNTAQGSAVNPQCVGLACP